MVIEKTEKVQAFLLKHKLPLAKIDKRLPIIIKWKQVEMANGGPWEEEFKLALTVFSANNDLDSWQDFVQVAIDKDLKHLIVKLRGAEVFCYVPVQKEKKKRDDDYTGINAFYAVRVYWPAIMGYISWRAFSALPIDYPFLSPAAIIKIIKALCRTELNVYTEPQLKELFSMAKSLYEKKYTLRVMPNFKELAETNPVLLTDLQNEIINLYRKVANYENSHQIKTPKSQVIKESVSGSDIKTKGDSYHSFRIHHRNVFAHEENGGPSLRTQLRDGSKELSKQSENEATVPGSPGSYTRFFATPDSFFRPGTMYQRDGSFGISIDPKNSDPLPREGNDENIDQGRDGELSDHQKTL